MPYKSLSELPKQVKDNIPKHAQEIYKEAFNSAWQEYKHVEDNNADESREEIAHKVAWSAVKKKYKKQDGKWISK